jgi:hypothetical protein
MKSGTSSLCRDLSEHPQIFMSPVKEPAHFSRAENWASGHERYLRLFEGASDQVYLAEGSTEYTKRPEYDRVAERIHAFNPEARIVYVVRDPFSRLVSHYRHEVRKGRQKGSLLEAVRRSPQYLLTSYYAYQIRPYLDLFGSSAVYLDTFESYTSAPREFNARLLQWLGVDPSFVPRNTQKPMNVSPEAVETYDEASLRVRVARRVTEYLKSRPTLARLIPESARQQYRRLMPKKSKTKTDSGEFVREMEKARAATQPLLNDYIAELQQLTGRSFDEWPSFHNEGSEDWLLSHSEDLLPEAVLQVSGLNSWKRDYRVA